MTMNKSSHADLVYDQRLSARDRTVTYSRKKAPQIARLGWWLRVAKLWRLIFARR